MTPVHPKVTAATAAGSAVALLVFFLGLPEGVAEAIVVLAVFVGGWLKAANAG